MSKKQIATLGQGANILDTTATAATGSRHDRHAKKTTNTTAIGAATGGLAQTPHSGLGVS